MTSAPLAQWLERLESLHPREIDLGLDRIRAVASRLDLLHPDCTVITVAGTNGKGSTVAVMEAALIALGRRTGTATSPHLLRFNERIRIDGREADDASIVAAFEAIEAAREDISLTYFEFGTLAALWLFARAGLDCILLEVGLGGRLDAANLVDANLAVMTSIALDHQEWLGETRDEIALEKAGILRPGIPVVVGEPDPPPALQHRLEEHDGPTLCYGRDYHARGEAGLVDLQLACGGAALHYAELPAAGLEPVNIATGLQALLVLGEDLGTLDLAALMGRLTVPGRRQRRRSAGREYLLDVAHNPAAVQALATSLRQGTHAGRRIALFAPMADKDIEGMLAACDGCFDAWFLADQPGVTRASRGSDVAGLLHQRGCGMISVSKNVRQALRRAQSLMGEGDQLVVFGSFIPVAAVMASLDRDDEKEAARG